MLDVELKTVAALPLPLPIQNPKFKILFTSATSFCGTGGSG
jgi:hypothetical protein